MVARALRRALAADSSGEMVEREEARVLAAVARAKTAGVGRSKSARATSVSHEHGVGVRESEGGGE